MPPDDVTGADRAAIPEGLVLASFPRRIFGLLLDEVIVLTPVFVAAVIIGYRPGDSITEEALYTIGIAASAVALVYETVMVALTGRTVGKFATRTRVVHAGDGGRIGWVAAFMRSLVPAAFGAVPQVGSVLSIGVYSLAFVHPRRQGLHDLAAGTLVVASTP